MIIENLHNCGLVLAVFFFRPTFLRMCRSINYHRGICHQSAAALVCTFRSGAAALITSFTSPQITLMKDTCGREDDNSPDTLKRKRGDSVWWGFMERFARPSLTFCSFLITRRCFLCDGIFRIGFSSARRLHLPPQSKLWVNFFDIYMRPSH